jgi:predicted nuclease of predicted toxin-antitoxin system
MRLLIDANLSPRLVAPLRNEGFDTTHVADIGLATATDSEIFDHAVSEGFAIVTADSDFAMLLALRRSTSPSVIQLRHVAELGSDAHVELLLSNLPAIVEELERGVVVSLSPTRLAIRDLPIR